MRSSLFLLIGVLLLPAPPALADAAYLRGPWAQQGAMPPTDMPRTQAWQIEPDSSRRFAPAKEQWLVAEQTSQTAAPAKTAAQAHDQAEARDVLAAAQANLAWHLIEAQTKNDNADTTLSPASLASAFAVLAQGADKPMKAAIVKTMGFEAADPSKSILTLTKARKALAAENGDILQSADRIVFAPTGAPPRKVAAHLKSLGIEYSVEDLSKREVVAKIDAWVNKTTKGMIPEILGGPLDKAAFVVLNAMHFKGQWKTPFDAQLTSQVAFQSIDGTSADVAMMRLPKAPRAYRTDDSFIGVDLPFSDERFSLTLVTTKEKPAKAEEFASAKDWLTGKGFFEHKGDLSMPRFKLSQRSDLLPALDTAGLDEARNSPTALEHFAPGAFLSGVIQRASIEVDEQGATAAAATAIFSKRGIESSADDSLHMVVDKPFIFALRDRESGMILVAGYVGHAPGTEATH
jgi:serine protease inhibitor